MADPYKDNVVLYLPMEGTRHGDTVILDKTGKTVTRNGDTILSTAVAPPFGLTSAYFDGTGDYLTLANTADLNPRGTMTIEAWVYPTTLAAQQRILTIDGNAAGTHVGHPLTIDTDGNVNFIVANDSNNTTYSYIITSAGAVVANTWHHIAVVKQGAVGRIYINGVDKTSDSTFSEEAEPNLVGSYVKIGAYHDNTGLFTGYIKDLRVTKGVARYTGNFYVDRKPFAWDEPEQPRIML